MPRALGCVGGGTSTSQMSACAGGSLQRAQIGAFDMFARLIERNLRERKEIKEELDRAIEQ